MSTTSLQLANIQPPPRPSLETQNSVKAHLLDKNAGEHLEEMLKRPTPFSADNKPPRGLKPVSHLPVRFCRDAISTALFGSFVNVIYKSLHNCSLQSRLQGPACPFQTADHARCLIRMLQIVFFRFMLQWLWPTLQYNGTRLYQFQETAECVICEMQRITLPVWKLALIFS